LGIKSRGWIDVLLCNDNEALWNKLFHLISRHSAIRLLYSQKDLAGDNRWDIYSDLTQGLFLKLLEKDRWQYYLELGYSDERVEQELYRIEVPNYVSDLQRERYPESYRLARRISELIKTRSEFRHYPAQAWSTVGATLSAQPRTSNKMVLKVYGLSSWPADKEVNHNINLEQSVRDVAFRSRDTRRTGRGSGSQVIISNEELTQLIVDIFTAVGTPLTVRKMRWLVMSKLLIEDSRFISLDAALTTTSERVLEPQKVDLPDVRPTPLDSLLDKEMKQQIENVAEALLSSMRKEVRNKPYRYSKLIEVAWHCYFNPASPSQTSIARIMGISDSLVSHYRCIFDTLIRSLDLTVDEFVHLNAVLGHRLAALKSEIAMTVSKTKTRANKSVKLDQLACQESARACGAVAASRSS